MSPRPQRFSSASWSVSAGLFSLYTVLVNWCVVGYMSRVHEPARVRLWGPFVSHPGLAFGVLAFSGAAAGFAAGFRSNKWFVAAILNIVTYALEFGTS